MLTYLESERIALVTILATYHHPDHVGGVAELASKYSAPVFGSARETIDAGRASLPSTLAGEPATNPFLRNVIPCIVSAASRRAGRPVSHAVGLFVVLRERKNAF